MKYTTRAFQARILDIIRQFEQDYPKASLQREADPYKTKLQHYVKQCNTSSLLHKHIEEELKTMPYWFSKIGYLVQSLRELLKINNLSECLDTDEREKAELESARQENLPQSSTTAQPALANQLKREQAKNKAYVEAIDKIEAEKRELLVKLNTEISKGVAYSKRIEELLSKQAELTMDQSFHLPDKEIIKELQQFVQNVMEENNRLSTDLIAINAKYIEALESNKLLQAKCEDLDKRYNTLQTQFNEQNKLLNNKLRLAQGETKRLRENLDERITQLERSQIGSFTNRKFHNVRLSKSSPLNVSGKTNAKTISLPEAAPSIDSEKFSL